MNIPCPCCSSLNYDECCQPFHEGESPVTALQLMRSRYSAYALEKPHYLIATTHSANPHYSDNIPRWEENIAEFCRSTTFLKLQIHDHQEYGTMGTVTFTAFLAQGKENKTFTERSYFEKLNGRWLYRNGEVIDGYAPDIAYPAPFRVLPLAYYGDPILTTPAEPVAAINPDIQQLAEEMAETMDACDGIGLAAPQIHRNLRMFVLRRPIEDGKGGYEAGEVKVFINPRISARDSETWEEEEGCLSIPGIHASVERPRAITIEYTNLNGETITEHLKGWEARVAQHEFDHIEGVLFIDHLDKTKLQPTLDHLKKRFQTDTKGQPRSG